MTVILTSPVEGKQPGALYTGANEAYLTASGYARKPKSGEVVTVTEGGSGLTSFTLTYAGQTTASLAAAATAAQVQTALENLSNIAPGELTVTGANGGPYTIRWSNGLTHALPTATPTGGSGTVVVANSGTNTPTGPGLDNTGPADTAVASNRDFDATRGQIARTSDLPEGGTNDGVVLEDADPAYVTQTGGLGNVPYPADFSKFDGFANLPNGPKLSITSVTKSDGTPATGLATAGGTTLRAKGFGFRLATAVKVGGVAATSVTKISDQEITFVTPAKAAGTYAVDVDRASDTTTATKAAAVTFA